MLTSIHKFVFGKRKKKSIHIFIFHLYGNLKEKPLQKKKGNLFSIEFDKNVKDLSSLCSRLTFFGGISIQRRYFAEIEQLKTFNLHG